MTPRAPRAARRAAGTGVELPPLPLRHPATIVAAVVAAAGVVLSVSFQLVDSDMWQHLAVGRAIWQLHRIPHEHLWTWANYGKPEVLPSWGFRALIWPVWEMGGVPALFVWRWVTTLLAFGFAWLAARRMGAGGLLPLVVAVWCSLGYGHRSQVRPETLAAVLLAVEIWMLESWRRGRAGGGAPGAAPSMRDGVWIAGLAAVAWAWANCHISYFLFFIVLGAHILDAARHEKRAPSRLLITFAIALGVSFLNPFGAAALWQPFDYFLHQRSEPIFRSITELKPPAWTDHTRDGVFVIAALWPLLALLRIRRRGFDLVEALLCAFMTWYLLQSGRFLGSYAVTAAAYFGRDLDEVARALRWPAWIARPPVRAAIAIALVIGVGAAEWSRPDRPLSISVDRTRVPIHALDFMEQHDVRGHGFGQMHIAGYQIWRFWPDSTRLPFMDIHQTGTREDRDLYVAAVQRRAGWPALDRGGRFDYVAVDTYRHDSLLTALDADTTLALVFLDDAGALYVRRAGRYAALADSFGYRMVGGGSERIESGFARAATDSTARAALGRELGRLEASSPLHSRAAMWRATLAYSQRRLDETRTHLEEAVRVDPRAPIVHYRLGLLALETDRPRDAVTELQLERRFGGPRPGLDYALGLAYRGTGHGPRAIESFQREIKRWPGTPSARAAEEALQGRR